MKSISLAPSHPCFTRTWDKGSISHGQLLRYHRPSIRDNYQVHFRLSLHQSQPEVRQRKQMRVTKNVRNERNNKNLIVNVIPMHKKKEQETHWKGVGYPFWHSTPGIAGSRLGLQVTAWPAGMRYFSREPLGLSPLRLVAGQVRTRTGWDHTTSSIAGRFQDERDAGSEHWPSKKISTHRVIFSMCDFRIDLQSAVTGWLWEKCSCRYSRYSDFILKWACICVK